MSYHTIQEIFQLLKDNNLNQLSLRTALILQKRCQDWHKQSRHDNRFTDFAESLLPCFDSPHSIIRQLALRLLQCFEAFLDVRQFVESENVQENTLSIFDILLKAEETPADFHQYRERAALLRRLKFTSLPNFIGPGSIRQLQLVVLKITLAQYYERLTVFWPLMVEVIESFACGLQIDEFWSALLTAVGRATAAITADGGDKAQQREGIRTDSIHIRDVSKIAKSQLVELNASAVDYSSFRIRMFKLMLHFPELAERRTRLISPLLLDIYRTEFLSLDSNASLPIPLSDDEATSAKTENADEESGNATVSEKSAAKRGVSYRRNAVVATSLKILLQLFSKFSSGKMADKQRELYDVYLKLLLSNDSEVQKNALECLFTYKKKFIQPYRENLQNLLNEKRLRDELVLFTVDEQNCVVADEHRSELIPIVMRILYGIFRTHAPARARAKARAKRAAIFRFIGSCKAEELGVFFRLIFEAVFDEFEFNGNSSFALTKTVESVSAKEAAVVPLRKLRSIMANIKDAVRNFAVSLNQEQVELSFGALMVCGVLIRSGLGSSDDYTTKLVRSLRIQFFDTLRQVLESFKSRVFTAEQLQCLITQIIEPMTRHYNMRLQPEDGSSATPTSWILPLSMARLVLYWIGVQRYRGLLNARVFDEASPLSLLCNTLSHPGTPLGMQFKILRGILQLLSMTPQESSAMPPPYTLELVPQLPVVTSTVQDAPLETLILLPKLNGLLQHLSEKIPRRAGKASKLPVIYLEILSRVSNFVQDGRAGALFVATLLSYLTDKRLMRNEGKLVQIMNTISDLSRHVEEPLACLSRLSKLISSLKERSARDALVNLVHSLRASKQVSTRVANLIEVFVSLEAWDKNRINEPDASVRLDAYDRIQKEYNSRSDVPKELLELLVHSHAYCMSHFAELSLRTVASVTLRALIGHIAKSSILEPDAKLPFVKLCVLPLVLEGMNSTSESCRFEFAQCLSTIVATFSDDPQFAALNEIDSACAEGKEDTGSGFFDSIMHLQVHRKQRAISKLNEQLNSPRMMDISHSVLLRFVYPLVKPYLLETSPKMASLVEHSLSLLCTIMKRTPWKGYYQVLEQYLKLVNDAEKTKTAIRVVAAILDAFHFHLDGRLDEEGGKDEQETGHLQVHKIVAESLMPRLVSCTRPNLPHYHRKAHVNDLENDDECLARAPLALSAVKLLTKLPKRTMDQYIHGFLSSLNRLLLSRSISVRKSARKIVCQVAQSLGPARLPSLLNELKQTMTKGYQMHVMIYTVHSIIAGMRESIRRGDLDTSLEVVLEVCKMELFGEAADDKESESIKVPEAKTSKSGDTYALLGEFISAARLDAVLKPMIDIVESKPSAETMRKLCELLRAFSTGLKKGGGIDPLELVRYSHGMLDRNLSTMLKHESQALVDRTKSIRPPSCLLLDPEPKRLGVIVKTSARSRVSVFVEFALQLLHDAIKARRGQRDPDERNTDKELLLELNPFVPLISDCLKLKYDKIVALSLRCLSLLLKYKLEQMSAESPSLVDRLFVILSEHAGQSTTASGRSVAVELTTILFKCFALIIRIAPLTSLTPKRVQLLLNYAEADLLDSHKQATAFSLVRVMTERKIEDEKISQLVDYLSDLAITSGDANVRVRCRQIVLLYVTAHPVGQKSCNRRLEFFLDQLEYEFEDGRLSALEMVHSMIDASPGDNEITFLAFVKLAPRLVNEESERCRNFASLTIRKLAGCVNQSVLNDLYLATKDWLSSEKEAVRLLSLRLFGEFMQSAVNFASRMGKIIAQVAVPLSKKNTIERCGEEYVRASYQFMALAVCKSPAIFLGALPPARSKAHLRFTENLRVAMRHADSADLRQSSTHLLSLMMRSVEQKVRDYVCNAIGLPTLCEDLCFQIGSDSLACIEEASSTLSDEIPLLGEEEFARVCHKLSRLCWKEAVRHPEEAIKRLTVFELLSQFARGRSLEPAKSDVLCAKFMPLIHRELNHKSPKHTDELYAAASEFATIVKRKVGEKKFTTMLSECQKVSTARVEERRREEKNLAVLDPAAAVARKQKRHERKKLAKKRKLDLLKPYRVAKRRRREKLAQEDADQMGDVDW